jgi:hypothetical protein
VRQTGAGDEVDELLMIGGAVARPIEILQRSGPLAPLLALVEPLDGVDHATVHARDGQYRASIPLDDLRRASLRAGRLQIPDAPTRCWEVKDVVRIELTVGPRPDSVPADRRG